MDCCSSTTLAIDGCFVHLEFGDAIVIVVTLLVW